MPRLETAQRVSARPVLRSSMSRPDSGADVQRAVALTLFFILLAGCFVVLRPFLAVVAWAAILVVATWPLYERVLRWSGGRRSLAALLMTLFLATLFLVPLALLAARLGPEVVDLAQAVQRATQTGLPAPPPWLAAIPFAGPHLDAQWRAADVASLRGTMESNMKEIRDWVLARGGDLGEGMIEVLLSLVTAFFFYRDAEPLADLVQGGLSKIAGSRSERIVRTVRATINGVMRGILGTAMVQAFLMAVGLALAGVPAPLFLGFVAFLLSLIPAGLALLWLPAAAWLALAGATGPAVFLAIWGAVVGALDNITRPLFMGDEAGLPFLLVLLGVVGGALSFGLVGLFLGPILLAVAASLIREWTASARNGG